jgi:hypothetical protein
MKSTPRVTNILREPFSPIFWSQKFTKPNKSREKQLNSVLFEKRAGKLLMKSMAKVNKSKFGATDVECPFCT